MAYTNWSVTIGHGPHGVTSVIYSPEMYNSDNYGFSYSGVSHQENISCGGGLVVNIKKKTTQYGGDNYSSRSNSIYQNTCCYVKQDFGNYNQSICFNGDTYLGVLDYSNTLLYNLNTWVDKDKNKR